MFLASSNDSPKNDLKKLYLMGSGGFGSVYKVEHRITKKLFALKEINLKGILIKYYLQYMAMST